MWKVTRSKWNSMITEYFWLQLYDMGLEDMWFQQDGGTSHTANVTINLLETKFGKRVICLKTVEQRFDIESTGRSHCTFNS